jgi:hypothetical protein
MTLKHMFIAVPAALLILGVGAANAGQSIDEAGVTVCVNDKWDEKEVEKGHKLVDYAGRCVKVPNDTGAEKVVEECVASTSTCRIRAGRAQGLAPAPVKAGTRHSTPGKRGRS